MLLSPRDAELCNYRSAFLQLEQYFSTKRGLIELNGPCSISY